MNKANKINPQAVTHAATVIKAQISDLTKQVRAAEPGPERDALELRLKEIMDSIDMEYVPNPDMKTAPAVAREELGDEEVEVRGVGAAMLSAAKQATERLQAEYPNTDLDEPAPGTGKSLWERAKDVYRDNKKKCWAGLAMVLGAVVGGIYYLVKIKNQTVSSVSGMVEVVETTETATEGGTEAAVSIFTRIGQWFVDAGAYIKNAAVGAWAWVKNLFNKPVTESNNGQPEVVVEAVPA